MLGVRIQSGIVLASTCHSATLPVVPVARSDRTTNQPFWARLRPSISCRSPDRDSIDTNRSRSSGAMRRVVPVASGRALMLLGWPW